VFCLSSIHSCASSTYTLAYSTVLTIVHLDGTSILSLYSKNRLAWNCDNIIALTYKTDYKFINCNVLARYLKLKELGLDKRV
jgi:hypothetical protein